ncbi:hypothetical protein F2Q68_00021524 [Brassica cretica]|uniref:Uncharacterized protein n=1 Tax=Brassica cretica TaxID=69181 RepID=A0A8S9FQ69_BRACR|nr:hypothetical protein F2Q68_00021524 [Brassica cretica]
MTTIKYKKSKREKSRSYSEFAFERYNKRPSEWLELGRYVATELQLRSDRAEWTFGCYVATEPWLELGRYCVNLAGFLKTLEYWQRDKFWDLVSRFLILCLEMLETSALGLGQDLGLLLVLEGAMTNSTYVSRFSFILIPYRFKVRDSTIRLHMITQIHLVFRLRKSNQLMLRHDGSTRSILFATKYDGAYDAKNKKLGPQDTEERLKRSRSRSRSLSCYGGDMPGQYSRDRPSARNS